MEASRQPEPELRIAEEPCNREDAILPHAPPMDNILLIYSNHPSVKSQLITETAAKPTALITQVCCHYNLLPL